MTDTHDARSATCPPPPPRSLQSALRAVARNFRYSVKGFKKAGEASGGGGARSGGGPGAVWAWAA
eukprot:12663762-Prorocentrum_lima.AAC.1